MHLFWQMPQIPRDDPIVEVGATILITHRPEIERLFFWALQADFIEERRVIGAGHLGLQYHPSYPAGGAANWGGYHGSDSTGSGELPGSTLTMPSTLHNVNTGDYPWQAGKLYRYRIYPSPERGWRGSITEKETGTETIIRDLWCPGSELGRPMVWTEAFAHCDDPSVGVQWSEFSGVTRSGFVVGPDAVKVNYQSIANGGCLTSSSDLVQNSGGGLVVEQRTGTVRRTGQGTLLRL